mgnify:CR=1 FL=1
MMAAAQVVFGFVVLVGVGAAVGIAIKARNDADQAIGHAIRIADQAERVAREFHRVIYGDDSFGPAGPPGEQRGKTAGSDTHETDEE